MTALVWAKLFHTLMGIPVRNFQKVYFDKNLADDKKNMQITQQVRVKIFLHSRNMLGTVLICKEIPTARS